MKKLILPLITFCATTFPANVTTVKSQFGNVVKAGSPMFLVGRSFGTDSGYHQQLGSSISGGAVRVMPMGDKVARDPGTDFVATADSDAGGLTPAETTNGTQWSVQASCLFGWQGICKNTSGTNATLYMTYGSSCPAATGSNYSFQGSIADGGETYNNAASGLQVCCIAAPPDAEFFIGDQVLRSAVASAGC